MAHLANPQSRDAQRVRNQRHTEPLPLNIHQRQAHAIHRNRSLARHLPGQPPRNSKPERGPLPLVDAAFECPDRVNVTGDEMAAQTVSHAQRTLQVDAAPRTKLAQVRAAQRFRARVELQPRFTRLHHGQTATVNRHAVPQRRAVKDRSGIHH